MTDPATDWDDLMVSLGLTPSTPVARPAKARAAATALSRKWRARVAGTLPADDPRHGKPGTYTNWTCRCPRCTAANTEAVRPRMAASRARRAA